MTHFTETRAVDGGTSISGADVRTTSFTAMVVDGASATACRVSVCIAAIMVPDGGGGGGAGVVTTGVVIGVVIGGVVVAPIASELILPIALAVQNRISVTDLAQTLSVYPSLGGSIVEAARRLMAHDDLD